MDKEYYEDDGGGGEGEGGDNYNNEDQNNYQHGYDEGYYGGEEYDPNAFEPMWVRALYDYDAAQDTEISFKENDIVCITQDYEDGWWCGDLNGNVGRVPANYFEYLDQSNQDHSNFSTNQDDQQQYQDNQQHYDHQHQNQEYYDENQQNYQQQQQQQDDDEMEETIGGVGGGDDNERKEMLRQKREAFKREMKEIQDKLKQQQQQTDALGDEIDHLEKQKEAAEEKVRVLKMLRFLNLATIKVETDMDVDSEVSMHARSTGIAVTQDLRALRTALAGIKYSSYTDQPKKQFDVRLEELEKKITANLNNLDVCDNLKKVLISDINTFQTEFEHLLIKDTAVELPLPPIGAPGVVIGIAPGVSPYNLPPPPGSLSSPPNLQGLGVPSSSSLTDKEKRKSVKEAKKLEKQEVKEQKKEMKKLEKKEKNDEPIWKPSKISK